MTVIHIVIVKNLFDKGIQPVGDDYLFHHAVEQALKPEGEV